MFDKKCNMGSVSLEPVNQPVDMNWLQDILQEFVDKTGSDVAAKMLQDWPACTKDFIKVFPHEYRRALRELAAETAALQEQLDAELENEYCEDAIDEKALKTPKEKVSYALYSINLSCDTVTINSSPVYTSM